MNIREANETDLRGLVDLLIESYETTSYSEKVKPDSLSIGETVVGFMATPLALILVAETDDKELVGTVGAISHPMWLNRDHVFVQEMFWYVKPDKRKSKAGKRLMQTLEDWSRRIGATSLCVASAKSKHQKRMNQIFIKQGFVETETQFTREL